jgi:hypothetical protein
VGGHVCYGFRHRILQGVGMMKDGRSQGGLNTVCLSGEACDTYQAKIIAILGEGLENSLWPARGQFAGATYSGMLMSATCFGTKPGHKFVAHN